MRKLMPLVLLGSMLLAPRAWPQAPADFRVACHTTAGDFTLAIHRAWAPHAADRFFALLGAHYYVGNAFYRVVPGFIVQWGLNPNPQVTALWRRRIPDDPVRVSNTKGTIAFADAGRNTRTTVVFINLRDNRSLDKRGFVPFGQVVAGMDVLTQLDGSYGDSPPEGHGPDPRLILKYGAAYLTRDFPRLDVIYGCRVIP
ncbi:MAG: peptidylprolyl isomerase [Terriglobales bacterium]